MNQPIDLMVQLKEQYDHAYFNTDEPLVSDEEYDLLIEQIRLIDPNHPCLVKTGTPTKKLPIELPVPMPSLHKVFAGRDINQLKNWIDRLIPNVGDSAIITPKLDGNSGLFHQKANGERCFYQRGDGVIGTNVSHYMGFTRNKLPEFEGEVLIRGEFIMNKHDFRDKYAKDYANPRNLVSGIMNSGWNNGISDVYFIAYDVPRSDVESIVDMGKGSYTDMHRSLRSVDGVMMVGYALLTRTNSGFSILENPISEGCYDFNDIVEVEAFLISLLNLYREMYTLEVDGLVITTNAPRVYHQVDNGSVSLPNDSFAFKVNSGKKVVVKDIHWKASMNKRLIPTIEVTPTYLSGALVTFVSGHNAKYILDTGIGKGAMLELTRSGEVIPYIQNVINPGIPPALPFDSKESGIGKLTWCNKELLIDEPNKGIGVEWDGPHLVISGFSQEALIAKILNAARLMEMDGWGESVITTLVELEVFSDLTDLYTASIERLLSVEGYGSTIVENLTRARQTALQKVSLPALMSASRCFGVSFGRKRFSYILDFYDTPDYFRDYPAEKIEKRISTIAGIGQVYRICFAKFYPDWIQFYDTVKSHITLLPYQQRGSTTGKLEIVFTLVRDKLLEKLLTEKGYLITDRINKETRAVITKDINAKSTKLDKARSLNIPIMNLEDARWTFLRH